MALLNRLTCPILAISPDGSIVRRMGLYYGVDAFSADAPPHTRHVLDLAAKYALQRDLAKSGEKIIVVSGRPIGVLCSYSVRTMSSILSSEMASGKENLVPLRVLCVGLTA